MGTTNGELQVITPPTSLAHLRDSDTAAIKPTSLLVGLLRAQSVITAMVTAPCTDAGVADGSFWLFACCTDKSVRRFKLPTDAHRNTARNALAALEQRGLARQASSRIAGSIATGAPAPPPGGGISAPQNFQMAETEKPLDLPAPASSVSFSPAGKHLVVAGVCGTTSVYSVPDLAVLARWPVCAPMRVEDTAVAPMIAGTDGPPPAPSQQYARCAAAALGSRMMVCAGEDGCVHVLEVTQTPGLAAARARAPPGSRQPSGLNPQTLVAPSMKLGAPPGLGTALPLAGTVAVDCAAQALRAAPLARGAVRGWREARLATQRHAKVGELRAFGERVEAKKAAWAAALRELRARNAAAGALQCAVCFLSPAE